VPPPYYGRGERERSAPADAAPGKAPAPAPSSEAPPSAAESAPSGRADGALSEGNKSRRGSGRPGLGTEFGEEMGSPVHEVQFVRANPSRPSVVLGMRYDDRQGLMALGIDVDRGGWEDDTYLRQTARPFPAVSRGYSTPPAGWQRW
jgi:hypothetical protein